MAQVHVQLKLTIARLCGFNMRAVSLAATICCSLVVADQPAAGTLATTHVEVTDDGLEEKSGISTRDYVITYPVDAAAAGQTYPLLVFAHGAAGGRIDMLAYQTHFNDLA